MSTSSTEFTAILDTDTQALGSDGKGLILSAGRYPIYNADGDYAERMLTLSEPGGDGTPQYRVPRRSATVAATCAGCAEEIYLYWSHRQEEEFGWRGHEFDETGRCEPAEQRAQIVVAHRPADDLA